MTEFRFNVGDKAWVASFEATETSVECPDCGGTGHLHVTFHDGETVAIECTNCSKGFEGPTGRVKVHNREPVARHVEVTGMNVDGGTVEWRTSWSYSVSDDDIFEDQDACLVAANKKAAEYDRAERDRVQQKEKDTRSWAWNASYHRKEIKKAEKEIAYHKSKLTVASLKAKEVKK